MAAKKPNILVLWGDDIGYWNISAYNLGMMGYKTPNIDRIAKEGALFTDWYGQQSCTAGRACFITGQSGFRTGLLKVGLPGAKEGLQARDVTIAELLKAQGYMTAQFGKNHLGDADETLPTAHGFDEFFGSLYHLNAEEEFENVDYFKDPALVDKFKTRGVLHCWANPGRHRRRSKPKARSARSAWRRSTRKPLTAALGYLEKAKKADKPFFLWWNSTRMHINTHLKPESRGQDRARDLSRRHGRARRPRRSDPRQAQGARPGRQHHRDVFHRQRRGSLHLARWRHHAVPRREERELGGRLSRAVRDPLAWRHQARHGQQRPVLARGHAADDPGGRRRARREGAVAQGHEGRQEDLQSPSRRLQPSPTARRQGREPAQGILLLERRRLAGRAALRQLEDRLPGATQRRLRRVAGSVHGLRLPKIINLRTDPFEVAEHIGIGYSRGASTAPSCWFRRSTIVGQFIGTFKEFPPSQKAGSFSLDQVLEKPHGASTSGK